MILKANYYGSPHIGIFSVCNENFAVMPKATNSVFEKMIKESLQVDVIKTSIAETSLMGVLSAINEEKIFVPNITRRDEIKTLEDFLDVVVLDTKYTAIGNLVCMNDKGAVCSKCIENELKKYIKVHPAEIAKTDLVGSAVYCNNDGFLAHRDSTDKEIAMLEKHLNVKGEVGTVNFGDPFVRSGIISNSKGMLVGEFTSGPELNRIDDIFVLSKKGE